jgi:hypothetical protein
MSSQELQLNHVRRPFGGCSNQMGRHPPIIHANAGNEYDNHDNHDPSSLFDVTLDEFWTDSSPFVKYIVVFSIVGVAYLAFKQFSKPSSTLNSNSFMMASAPSTSSMPTPEGSSTQALSNMMAVATNNASFGISNLFTNV